jgi:hypothetical protein
MLVLPPKSNYFFPSANPDPKSCSSFHPVNPDPYFVFRIKILKKDSGAVRILGGVAV